MPRVKRRIFLPIFYFLTVYLFFFLLKSPQQAQNACVDALKLCYLKVIPSLFPFLILNELMFSSGLSSNLGRRLGNVFSKLFGISPQSSVCFVCGSLFGFPLGTKSVCSLYEKGEISREEAERLVCFCSNTGPAFIIGFIGSILQNRSAAVCIYLCQIASAVIIGLFLRKKEDIEYINTTPTVTFSLSDIPRAVSSSVLPMLNICAFVCFFSCVSISVESIVINLQVNEYTEILFTGFLELTNGINKLDGFSVNSISIWLCSFFAGWSGISVIMQSMCIMSECKLKTKGFVICKLIQGVICANLSVLLCKLFNLY